MKRLLSMFATGLATLLPVVLSLYFIWWIFKFVDGLLAPVLQALLGQDIIGLGFIITVILITFIGFISRNYLGHRLLKWWENIYVRIPLLGKIYAATKRITRPLFSSGRTSFRQVVLVEFPRHGIYALGFITNDEFPFLDEESYAIFIPTTPNPTSGYLVIMPRNQVKILDITVDQGLEMIISAGMVIPTDEDILD
ncbi:DUF502 domain-containing protein [Syntrophomonas erecta]